MIKLFKTKISSTLTQRKKLDQLMCSKNFNMKDVDKICREVTNRQYKHIGELSFDELNKVNEIIKNSEVKNIH